MSAVVKPIKIFLHPNTSSRDSNTLLTYGMIRRMNENDIHTQKGRLPLNTDISDDALPFFSKFPFIKIIGNTINERTDYQTRLNLFFKRDVFEAAISASITGNSLNTINGNDNRKFIEAGVMFMLNCILPAMEITSSMRVVFSDQRQDEDITNTKIDPSNTSSPHILNFKGQATLLRFGDTKYRIEKLIWFNDIINFKEFRDVFMELNKFYIFNIKNNIEPLKRELLAIAKLVKKNYNTLRFTYKDEVSNEQKIDDVDKIIEQKKDTLATFVSQVLNIKLKDFKPADIISAINNKNNYNTSQRVILANNGSGNNITDVSSLLHKLREAIIGYNKAIEYFNSLDISKDNSIKIYNAQESVLFLDNYAIDVVIKGKAKLCTEYYSNINNFAENGITKSLIKFSKVKKEGDVRAFGTAPYVIFGPLDDLIQKYVNNTSMKDDIESTVNLTLPEVFGFAMFNRLKEKTLLNSVLKKNNVSNIEERIKQLTETLTMKNKKTNTINLERFMNVDVVDVVEPEAGEETHFFIRVHCIFTPISKYENGVETYISVCKRKSISLASMLQTIMKVMNINRKSNTNNDIFGNIPYISQDISTGLSVFHPVSNMNMQSAPNPFTVRSVGGRLTKRKRNRKKETVKYKRGTKHLINNKNIRKNNRATTRTHA